MILEIAVVGLLILINGFFAMSELALVSSRRGRLQQLAQTGRRGAASALKLTGDPTGFLSTVQIGITVVGVFAGAYGGATLAARLAEVLKEIPPIAGSAESIAFVVVVVAITYLSLVVGELVPKRLALSRAEAIAATVAPAMTLLARAAAPVVWFLRVSTEAVLRLTGARSKPESTVTEEEVKTLIAEGTLAGIFEPAEREMIEGVLRIGDRAVRSIMVPRPEVVWLDIEDSIDAIHREIVDSGHSRFPVCRGDVDEIVGYVETKHLLQQQRRDGRIDLAAAALEPMYVSDQMPILRLLDRFKRAGVHLACVLDEHGSFEGIVTPTDILTAIAGDLPDREDDEEPAAARRDDGSWLLDGRMPIDAAERVLAVTGMGDGGDFHTLAGFVLDNLGHLPEPGESFVWRDWRFEVVDMDGRRIDKILARPPG
ncbi:MAG: hemolysin family protein [Rhodospirillales bacterium]